MTSATATRTKTFSTPIGTFDYTGLSHRRYAIGIDQKENRSGRFLIATPEKALADLVYAKAKNLKPDDLLIDLIEARRMDETLLQNLDKKHLYEIAQIYRSKAVMNLFNAVGML